MLLETLLLVHAAATTALAGLVWFVQVVHYPLFARVGGGAFATYEDEHCRRTSRVVVPLMLVELASAVGLAALAPGILSWAGLALLAAVWLSTFLLQVPRHGELSAGFDPGAHRRLVATNWIRTAAWSARGVVALALVAALG